MNYMNAYYQKKSLLKPSSAISVIKLLLPLLFALPISAKTTEGQRTWFGIVTKKRIHENYDAFAEVQLRHDESHQMMGQILNRFGLLKELSAQHEFGFLFAYVNTNNLNGSSQKEYRPTLQYTYRDKFRESDQVSIRSRLEGRDIEDNDANSLRFRTQIRFSHKLDSKYDLVLWDEPFATLTHEGWTGNRFFDRNRAFLGTRINWQEIAMEVGYMNQYTPRKGRNLSEHTLIISFAF